MHTYMVVIYGPTGVGKSDIAERVAHNLFTCYGQRAALVNVDMGQCYVPLTIGTAKPLWRSSNIPHYLFDIINTPTRFTVVEYRQALLEVLEHLWSQGVLPILVGGSGFYVKSLFFPPRDLGMNKTEDMVVDDEKPEELWQRLNTIDPERAQVIHPHDIYRLRRALDIWRTTGQKPSHCMPDYKPIAPTLLVCIQRERAELHDRINKRVLEMMNAGWVAEVQALQGTPWESFVDAKKIIGYDDILRYLQKKITLEDSIQVIQQKTRAYAKRQMTFWRMLKKEIVHNQRQLQTMPVVVHEMNLTSIDIDLYIKQLSNDILQKMSGK